MVLCDNEGRGPGAGAESVTPEDGTLVQRVLDDGEEAVQQIV